MDRLQEIEDWYNSVKIPAIEIKTKTGIFTDVNKFISSHIKYCKANKDNKSFITYYERLILVKDYIVKNKLIK